MPHNLTSRQLEVVRLTSLDSTSTEIVRILGVAANTVDAHRSEERWMELGHHDCW